MKFEIVTIDGEVVAEAPGMPEAFITAAALAKPLGATGVNRKATGAEVEAPKTAAEWSALLGMMAELVGA